MNELDSALDLISSRLAHMPKAPYWMTEEFQNWVTQKWALTEALGWIMDHPNEEPDSSLVLLSTKFYIYAIGVSNIDSKMMFQVAADTVDSIIDEITIKGDL